MATGRLLACLTGGGVREFTRYLRLSAKSRRLSAKSRRPGQVLTVRPRTSDHSLNVRAGTSDVDVYRQIFVEREYRFLDDMRDVRVVVDCGANVGFSTAYFLSRFPNCRVVAIEPDAGNFDALCKNTRAWGERVRTIAAGIWGRTAGLKVECDFRDGREWSRTVREVLPGEEADVPAVDIESLMSRHDINCIDILKVDIEGSEVELFGTESASWIDRVRTLVIELHGPECERAVTTALGASFGSSRHGELTFYARRKTG